MSALPKPLRFSAEEADRAFEAWGCNCGPGAIAAVLGLTLEELRPYLGDFETKHYTNPTLMWDILRRLGASFRHSVAAPDAWWPGYGLARVQWEGPWTAPGVPARAAYRHTHWVGAQRLADGRVGVFDINCMSSGGWVNAVSWSDIVVPEILEQCVPKANGKWHLTHVVEVTP